MDNKALHLTLCRSLGLLPQDRRSHESVAEAGRYVAPVEACFPAIGGSI